MATIPGYVYDEKGGGVEGVCVSNGREVVRTDEAGRYELPRFDEVPYVWVTVPAGYAPMGHFYRRPTVAAVDFMLRGYGESAGEVFSFVQISDMHISTEQRSLPEDFRGDLRWVLEEVGGEAQFVVVTGDLTGGGKAEEYAAYLEVLEGCELPFFHVAGNHDDDAEVAGAHFAEHLGPLYYSFDWGPVHFAVYDGEAYMRRGRERVGNFEYVASVEDEWLRADLAAQPEGRPVVVLNHFPWGSEFYGQWGEFPIIATLSGHWHSTRLFVDGETAHYNAPSFSFGGIDQSPRAYRLFTYEGGRLRVETRTLAAAGVFAGITFRPSEDNVAGQVERRGDLRPQADAEWALFQGNIGRTGAGTQGPQPPLELSWKAGTGGSVHMASPLVAEGKVFQAVKNEDRVAGNGLVALEAESGELCWAAATGAALKRAPAYGGGLLFAVTMTGQVVALNAGDGEEEWTYQLGDPSRRWVYSSPLAWGGRVYTGVSSHFVALDQESGEVAWQRDDLGSDDWISSYPSPAALGRYLVMAFYTQPTNLAVLEASTGKTVWCKEEGKSHHMYATPVVDAEGSIYTVSGSAVRAFVLETGALRWEVPVALNRSQASPALAGGRLFVPTASGALHALDVGSGREVWRWDVGEEGALFTPYVRSGPATLTTPVVAGGYLYIGAANGGLYVLEAGSGQCVWQQNLGVPLAAGPALSGNGLWVGGCDGCVYAFVHNDQVEQ